MNINMMKKSILVRAGVVTALSYSTWKHDCIDNHGVSFVQSVHAAPPAFPRSSASLEREYHHVSKARKVELDRVYDSFDFGKDGLAYCVAKEEPDVVAAASSDKSSSMPNQVLIHATKGFPHSRKLGIKTVSRSGRFFLKGVSKTGWASQSTDLESYVGWQFVTVNSQLVRSKKEFLEVTASLKPRDFMTFVLENPERVRNADDKNLPDSLKTPITKNGLPREGNHLNGAKRLSTKQVRKAENGLLGKGGRTQSIETIYTATRPEKKEGSGHEKPTASPRSKPKPLKPVVTNPENETSKSRNSPPKHEAEVSNFSDNEKADAELQNKLALQMNSLENRIRELESDKSRSADADKEIAELKRQLEEARLQLIKAKKEADAYRKQKLEAEARLLKEQQQQSQQKNVAKPKLERKLTAREKKLEQMMSALEKSQEQHSKAQEDTARSNKERQDVVDRKERELAAREKKLEELMLKLEQSQVDQQAKWEEEMKARRVSLKDQFSKERELLKAQLQNAQGAKSNTQPVDGTQSNPQEPLNTIAKDVAEKVSGDAGVSQVRQLDSIKEDTSYKPEAKILSAEEYKHDREVQDTLAARKVLCFHAANHKKHYMHLHRHQKLCKHCKQIHPKPGNEDEADDKDWVFQCLGHVPREYVESMEEDEPCADSATEALEEMTFEEFDEQAQEYKPMSEEDKKDYIQQIVYVYVNNYYITNNFVQHIHNEDPLVREHIALLQNEKERLEAMFTESQARFTAQLKADGELQKKLAMQTNSLAERIQELESDKNRSADKDREMEELKKQLEEATMQAVKNKKEADTDRKQKLEAEERLLKERIESIKAEERRTVQAQQEKDRLQKQLDDAKAEKRKAIEKSDVERQKRLEAEEKALTEKIKNLKVEEQKEMVRVKGELEVEAEQESKRQDAEAEKERLKLVAQENENLQKQLEDAKAEALKAKELQSDPEKAKQQHAKAEKGMKGLPAEAEDDLEADSSSSESGLSESDNGQSDLVENGNNKSDLPAEKEPGSVSSESDASSEGDTEADIGSSESDNNETDFQKAVPKAIDQKVPNPYLSSSESDLSDSDSNQSDVAESDKPTEAELKKLLQEFADEHMKGDILGKTEDEEGDSLLHIAAEKGEKDLIKPLVDHGCDPNLENNQRRRPLHSAAATNKASCVKVLVDIGAELNAMDDRIWTALHIAAQGNSPDCVQALVDLGADRSIKTSPGSFTALALAKNSDCTECVKILEEAGKAKNKLVQQFADAEMYRGNLLGRKDGKSALHIAAEKGMSDMIKPIANEGCDPNANDVLNECKPIHYAAFNNKVFCLKPLVEVGARLDAKDRQGITALHGAAWNGHAECVKVLLDLGADASIQSISGQTALDQAEQRNHTECVKILEAA